MADPVFDVLAARKDGVPDSAIASFLASRSGFDLDAARKDGVPDAAIVDFLASKQGARADASAKATSQGSAPQTPPPEAPSTLADSAAPASSAEPKREPPSYYRPAIGANKLIADVAGAPVDAATWVINKGGQAVGGEPIKDPIGGSESIKKAMGVVGANPDQFTPPTTTTDKLLETAGEGAASLAIPGAALARTAAAPRSLGTVLGDILGAQTIDDSIAAFVRGTLGNLAIGATGAVGAEVAADAAPEPLKPLAALAGGVGGGIATAGVLAGGKAAITAGGRALQSAIEPAEMQAARTILDRAQQPQTLRQAVAETADTPPIVEGSQPTTFQATGDLGVGALEREVAASPKGVPRFAERRQEQNSARLGVLEGVAPEGDPQGVVDYIRRSVQKLKDTFGERLTAVRTALDEKFQAGRLNEAEYGTALREAPIRLRTEMEKAEDSLWAAVDPDRTVPFDTTALKGGVDAIEKSIPRTAKPPEGEERALFDVVRGLDETTTFGDIIALRSRLTDELRDITGSPTVRRRVALMLREVDGALGDSASMAPEVLERYAAARAATRDVKTRFGEGAVGRALAPGPNDGFRMTASNVARNLFDRPEDLRAYLSAVGDDAAARGALQDYAAFSLQKAAVKDGLLSPSRYQQWLADHDYVLKEFPDLAAKFADTRKAQGALDDALAAQKEALAASQTDAVKALLSGQEPAKVVESALRNPGKMAELVAMVSGDPAAGAGLKRAAAEVLLGKARSTAEEGTSGVERINAATLQKFFLQNRKALASVFDDGEMQNISNVISDLQRANRSIVAVKIPGGSNTAQDTASRLATMVGDLWRGHAGKAAGMAMDPTGGAIGLGAGIVVDGLRAARQSRIEDALVDMMLDPKMAAAWLSKVPIKTDADAGAFARQLRMITNNQVTPRAAGAVVEIDGQSDRRRDAFEKVAQQVGEARESTNTEPTDGQKEAGNYLKGRVSFHGLPFVMENPEGSVRRGVDADGKPWEAKLPADYGYISRTEGADGDQVDAYIGPDHASQRAWVVDQIDPKTGKFDEHKVLMGFQDLASARDAYERAFSDGSGPSRIGAVTEMPIDELKAWLREGNTKRPVGKTSRPAP